MTNRSHRIAFAICAVAAVSCHAEPAPKPAGEARPISPAADAGAPRVASSSTETDDSALLAALPSAKVDLAQAIAQAEREGARAISAKFELERGRLSLSVYTAKGGLEADAEHNVLAELSGDPTGSDWQPREEIFADAKHLTRASYHLTLVQRAHMALADVIAKALAKQPGQIYSIEPGIHEHSPVFHVLIASPGRQRIAVDVESEG
jgi:hypothetical protein